MKHQNRWFISVFDDERWEATESFETREEAIAVGRELIEEYNNSEDRLEHYWDESILGSPEEPSVSLTELEDYYPEEILTFEVGQATVPDHILGLGDWLLDTVAEQARDVGGEFADGYISELRNVKDGVIEDLNEVIHRFFVEKNLLPSFYRFYKTYTVDVYRELEEEE